MELEGFASTGNCGVAFEGSSFLFVRFLGAIDLTFQYFFVNTTCVVRLNRGKSMG